MVDQNTPRWRREERQYEDDLTEVTTLPDAFERAVNKFGDKVAQEFRPKLYERTLPPMQPSESSGGVARLTYSELSDVVRYLAFGLHSIGVEHGDYVGIYAPTRAEWAQADLAILSVGAIPVPISPKMSDGQVERIIDNMGMKAIVVDDEDELATVSEMDTGELEIVVMDSADTDPSNIHTFGELYDQGKSAFDPQMYSDWLQEQEVDDVATVMYTSGTTSQSKGVELTHDNIARNIGQLRKRYGPRDDKDNVPVIDSEMKHLSFLPLAHVYERVLGHFTQLLVGSTVAYAESKEKIPEEMERYNPRMMTGVPSVYEQLITSLRESLLDDNGLRRKTVEMAFNAARTQSEGDGGLIDQLKWWMAGNRVVDVVDDFFGGEMELLFTGGASMPIEDARLLDGFGFEFVEVYGLTEMSPFVTTNPVEQNKLGTVGLPLPGVESKLDHKAEQDDISGDMVGELLLKGDTVFHGYHSNQGSKQDHFNDEGWFCTGDLFTKDDDGYLKFHGRDKQLLVLQNGMSISPTSIEEAMSWIGIIDHIVVFGDDRDFVSALIVPDFDRLRKTVREAGVTAPETREGLVNSDAANELMHREVEQVNERLSEYEEVKEFRLLADEWTADSDVLTTTLKPRRDEIKERYGDELEEMYGEPSQDG